MIFFTFLFEDREATVREMEECDMPTLIGYWHDSAPAYLESIGVDLRKLGTCEETEAKFRSALSHDDEERKHVAIVVEHDGDMVAYTNSYIDDSKTGYPHVHVLKAGFRHKGLASRLFRPVMKIYFDHYGLVRLIFQTSPENLAINMLLRTLGLEFQEVEILNPSGMARPGTFYNYEVLPAVLEALPSQRLGT